MKRAGFKPYFIIYLIVLTLCATTATLLQLYSLDPVTGFVDPGNFPFDSVLIYVLRAGLLLPILFWFIITIVRRSHHDYPISYRHLLSGMLSVITGLAMAAYTWLGLPEQIAAVPNMPSTNRILMIALYILGTVGGFSLIVGGIRPKYGIYGKPGAMLGFFPALWQLIVLLVRFNTFIAITTIQDVLFVILFMCFAAVFLIGQSRIIFGLGIRNGKTYAIPSGLSVSLIGLTFAIPHIVEWLIRREMLFHLPMSIPEFCYITSLSLYAVVFLAGYSKSIRVV